MRLTLCDGLLAVCSVPADGIAEAVAALEAAQQAVGMPPSGLASTSGDHLGALAPFAPFAPPARSA